MRWSLDRIETFTFNKIVVVRVEAAAVLITVLATIDTNNATVKGSFVFNEQVILRKMSFAVSSNDVWISYPNGKATSLHSMSLAATRSFTNWNVVIINFVKNLNSYCWWHRNTSCSGRGSCFNVSSGSQTRKWDCFNYTPHYTPRSRLEHRVFLLEGVHMRSIHFLQMYIFLNKLLISYGLLRGNYPKGPMLWLPIP